MADMLNDGNNKYAFVPVIANIAAPTVTELTATGVVDLSCLIKADGVDSSVDEDTVDNSKLCDTDNYEEPGRIKYNWQLTYVRKDTPAEDLAYTTMKRLTRGFLVERVGKPHADAFAADDEVSVYTITCGAQQKLPPEPNSAVWVQQKLFVSGPSEQDVAVVAGA